VVDFYSFLGVAHCDLNDSSENPCSNEYIRHYTARLQLFQGAAKLGAIARAVNESPRPIVEAF
jgi:hypothetical protein